MPGWIQPIKNEWLTRSRLISTFTIDGKQSFSAWFASVSPRLRCGLVPVNGPQQFSRRYLVKHLWAIARAHGLHLRPADGSVDARVSDLERENAELRDKNLRASLPLILVNNLRAASGFENGAPLIGHDELKAAIFATEPCRAPGVYFLLGEDECSILYIGQSVDVLGRMAGHADKPYHRVRMIRVDDLQQRLLLERTMIAVFNPPLNKAMCPRHIIEGTPQGVTA